MLLKWGKKIYTAADTLRSEEENYNVLLGYIGIIVFVILFKLFRPDKGWTWLGIVLLIGVTAFAADAVTRFVFYNLLDGICKKFYHTAQTYDMRMLARTNICWYANKSSVKTYGNTPDAKIGIEDFLKQERGKELYQVIRVKGK